MRLFILIVIAAFACAVAFVGCGTDSVLAPQTDGTSMSPRVASQPFVLGAAVDTSTTPILTDTPPPPRTPPKDGKKPPPPPDKKPTEDTTFGELKSRNWGH